MVKNMKINLADYNYFTFSLFNTSLKTIEKYIFSDSFFTENGFGIMRMPQSIVNICFEYNPKIVIAYFVKTSNGTIMLPNLQDGWSSLFYRITCDLKISGYRFTLSSNSEKEPYNCMVYIEDGLEKRVISNIKEDKKWTFYEKGAPLCFEDIENYKNKLKRNRLNQDIIIKYLHELNITKESMLEIQNNENDILIIKYNSHK
jgi:hypothetical protein